MPDLTCLQCGGAIPGPHYPSRPRKFCGNECKFAYQKEHPPRPRQPRVTQPCANPACGNTVTFLPTQRGAGRPGRVHVNGKWYDYSERVHCSVACKHAGQRIVMTGRRPSSGIYADTYSFRASVRAAFIDRCSLCGWAKAPCDLAHIEARNGDPGKDRLENVTMLCPNHHRMFDKGLIPVEQVRAARDTVLR